MNDLTAALEARRAQLATLTAEIEQLEAVARMLGGAGQVKPPPPARKEKTVRAEKEGKSGKSARVVYGPGDKTYKKCGHPRTKENSYETTYVKKDGTKSLSCRACALGKEPSTKSEPDPAPKVLATAVAVGPAPHVLAAAKKWAGQCPMLDSGSGKRCSLPGGHAMPHSASGRTFSAAAAVNIAAMGGTARSAG